MIHGERCVSERRDPVGISPGPCLTTSLVEACSLMAHVKLHIPGPVRNFRIDVKEKPGFSYPKPVKQVSITEHKHMPPVIFRQPHGDKHEHAFDVPDAIDCE